MKFGILMVLALGFTVVASAAENLPAQNRLARGVALREMQRKRSDRFEASAFRGVLKKYRDLGIDAGPLCLQLRNGCYTQAELGYRSSEYFNLGGFKNIAKAGIYTSVSEARLPTSEANEKFNRIAESNGVSPLALMLSLEAKEKLEIAYLAAYRREHPNTPAKHEGNLDYAYSWKIDENGKVVEVVSITGQGD